MNNTTTERDASDKSGDRAIRIVAHTASATRDDGGRETTYPIQEQRVVVNDRDRCSFSVALQRATRPGDSVVVAIESDAAALLVDRVAVGDPDNWRIDNVDVGGREVLPRPISGSALRGPVETPWMTTAQTAMRVTVRATNIGDAAARFCVEAMCRVAVPTAAVTSPSLSRLVLPMSSGFLAPPNQPIRICASVAEKFKPQRILIGGTAADWIVRDVVVDLESQMSLIAESTERAPGSSTGSSSLSGLDPLPDGIPSASTEFSLVVEYVGSNPDGEPFYCGIVGLGFDVSGIHRTSACPRLG